MVTINNSYNIYLREIIDLSKEFDEDFDIYWQV